MELAIKKWGNSAAVRLPSILLESLNLKLIAVLRYLLKMKRLLSNQLNQKYL